MKLQSRSICEAETENVDGENVLTWIRYAMCIAEFNLQSLVHGIEDIERNVANVSC